MRNVFSRRDFLKASAAAVLAASAAGVLTGCDGGGSEIPSATIGLGEFEVTMTGNMTITGDEVVGNENANGYLCKPNADSVQWCSQRDQIQFCRSFCGKN